MNGGFGVTGNASDEDKPACRSDSAGRASAGQPKQALLNMVTRKV